MKDPVIENLRHLATIADLKPDELRCVEAAAQRIDNLLDALDHAKLEFYAAGRRDLVVELLAELGYLEQPERIVEAAAAGEDFTKHPRLGMDQLAKHYFQTVEEMKAVPRFQRGNH